MKLVLLALLLFACSARAEEKPQKLVSCWDGTYAYSQLNVTTLPTDARFLTIEMESEQQDFLAPLAISTPSGWGQGKIQFTLSQTECEVQTDAPKLVDCVAKNNILNVSYDESFESRRELRIVADEITLKTSIKDGAYQAKITVTRAGAKTSHTARLQFPMFDGLCHGFPN